MNNKKYLLSFCLCLFGLMLTGCVQNMTEEQEDLIAEYSAGVVLQHEEGYERKLIKQEASVPVQSTVQPEATVAPVVTPEPQKASGEEKKEPEMKEISLDELLDVSGMETTYRSYEICRHYSDTINAREGELLYVVKFRVKNKTNKPLKVNLAKRKLKYILKLDSEEYQAHLSLLENGGMNFLKTTLSAKASEEAVVVFVVPSRLSHPSSAVISVCDGDQTQSEIRLK